MTDKLKKYIPKFSMLNCEYITFHIEATDMVEKYITMIHSYGIKCGIAINPETPVDKVKDYLDMVELVLVMSVKPGYGGQAFIEDTTSKLEELRNYINNEKLNVVLNVDGGINQETFEKVKPYVDMVVAGSYITGSDNYQEKIDTLR
jgi:ribulose-phosphate 3-epimerase